MNGWAAFQPPTLSKHAAIRPFNVSGFVDLDVLAKKAVQTAIKAGVFDDEDPTAYLFKKKRVVRTPTHLRKSKFVLDVQCEQKTERPSLFHRLGETVGTRKFLNNVIHEAQYEPALLEDDCISALQSEKAYMYFCYLLGSENASDERAAREITLLLKETLVDNIKLWSCRADALQRCFQTILSRQKAANALSVECGVLATA